jgi:hypothetical protein
VVGALALLNRRDRRQAALARLAYRQLDAEALRTDVTVEARCGLLGGSERVTVDMRGASREAVWFAVARLRRGLPASVRLSILGPVAPVGRVPRLPGSPAPAPSRAPGLAAGPWTGRGR